MPEEYSKNARIDDNSSTSQSSSGNANIYANLYRMFTQLVGWDIMLGLFGQLQSLLGLTLALCTLIGNLTFQLFLYLTLSYYFLDLDYDLLDNCLKGLAVENDDVREKVVMMAIDVIKGLFAMNIVGAILQAVYTWLILDAFGVSCIYLYGLVAAFFKTVPFASP